MTSINWKTIFGGLLVLLVVVGLFSCDSLEADSLPDDKIKIEGSKLYTLTNTSAYIDLHVLVKTKYTAQDCPIQSRYRIGDYFILTKEERGTFTPCLF